MNTYRVKFRTGSSQIVKADNVKGFNSSCDTYVFRADQDVVAAVPKNIVRSVVKVKASGDLEDVDE